VGIPALVQSVCMGRQATDFLHIFYHLLTNSLQEYLLRSDILLFLVFKGLSACNQTEKTTNLTWELIEY
jgi:hypothetical protein